MGFFTAATLPPGTIIHFPVDFGEPGGIQPHFVIVVCCDTVYYDCLIVTTDPTDYQLSKQILREHLLTIDCATHKFLDYDSVVNCAEFQRIRVQDVRQYLREKPKEKRGFISADLREQIVNAIVGSKLFSEEQKKDVFDALG